MPEATQSQCVAELGSEPRLFWLRTAPPDHHLVLICWASLLRLIPPSGQCLLRTSRSVPSTVPAGPVGGKAGPCPSSGVLTLPCPYPVTLDWSLNATLPPRLHSEMGGELWGGGSDSELQELWPRPDGAWEVSAVITTPVITHLLAAKWKRGGESQNPVLLAPPLLNKN